MLFRNNIMALVGNPDNTKFLETRVTLWDDFRSKDIGDLKM